MRDVRIVPSVLFSLLSAVAVLMTVLTTAVFGLIAVASGAAQRGAPSHAFEVASVKPNKSGDGTRGRVDLQPGGRLTATNVTLRQLIQSAYQRHAFDRLEISGGPPWIDSDRFDIVAKAAGDHSVDPDGVPRRTWLMLRTLLAERFKLRVHDESRELPIYALVTARSDGKIGPQLRKSDVDCAVVFEMWNKGQRPTIEPGKGPPCSFGFGHAGPDHREPRSGHITGNAVPMSSLANFLSPFVNRVVVDRTGLTGNFDLELEAAEIRPPGPLGPSARPSDTTQSIFTALPEQLGLALDSTRGPVDVLVIDRVEQPTPDQ
jgi:uncharacterized protein (TIGR03435 family)